MRSFLLAVLLALSSSLFAGSVPTTAPYVIAYAFSQACELSEINCEGIPLPTVSYEFFLPYAWGIYAPTYGEDTVWLDASLMGSLVNPYNADTFALSILIHEIVHYIDYHGNGNQFVTNERACTSESIAWSVTNRWLISVGAGKHTRWDWRDGYKNCQ